MAITIVNPGGSGSSGGGTLVKTGSYNAAAGDSGQLIVFNVNSGGSNQATYKQSNSTTAASNFNFASNALQGSFLMAMGRAFSATSSPTITDTVGNTWVSVPGFPGTNGSTKDFFLYCQSNKATSTIGATLAATGLTGAHWNMLEYSGFAIPVGVAVASVYDGVENFATGSSSTPNSGNITTNTAVDLLIGWISNETADGLTVTVPPTGWTQRQNQNGNVFTWEQALTATATKNLSCTVSSSVSWFAGIAAFVAQTNVTVNYTLLAVPSSSTWFVYVTNESTMSTVTVNPNGAQLNGTTASFSLGPGQTCRIFTDGTNYFLN